MTSEKLILVLLLLLLYTTTLYISYFVLSNVFTNLYGMELRSMLVAYKMFASSVGYFNGWYTH